ncbi:hypothetical protein [Asticcacaulis biprosthecium]|nr:hypothetical protein [Asticcacaulis biprosthecium]
MQFTFLFLVILYGLFFETGILQDHYLFYSLRDPRPLFWWPVRTLVVMVGLIGVSIVLFILSRTQWRETVRGWAAGLLAIGVVVMLSAIALDTTSGVAVYSDRAESRILTFKGYQTESLPYSQVRYVTLGCKVAQTRGTEEAQVFYALHGDHGVTVDLQQGLVKRAPDSTWLKAVHTADSVLPALSVRREVEPRPDSASQYKGCVERFRRQQSDADKALVTEIFERPEITTLL